MGRVYKSRNAMCKHKNEIYGFQLRTRLKMNSEIVLKNSFARQFQVYGWMKWRTTPTPATFFLTPQITRRTPAEEKFNNEQTFQPCDSRFVPFFSFFFFVAEMLSRYFCQTYLGHGHSIVV